MQGRMSPAGYEKRVTAILTILKESLIKLTSARSVPPGMSVPAR